LFRQDKRRIRDQRRISKHSRVKRYMLIMIGHPFYRKIGT